MKDRIPKDYIIKITKASAYFIFRNGPVKKLYDEGNSEDRDIKEMQKYMQNHLAYLFNILLEENDLKKFDLIISTMDKFYISDSEEINLDDDGFDNFYNNLFNDVMNTIKIKK
jgi:hypothetical protein